MTRPPRYRDPLHDCTDWSREFNRLWREIEDWLSAGEDALRELPQLRREIRQLRREEGRLATEATGRTNERNERAQRRRRRERGEERQPSRREENVEDADELRRRVEDGFALDRLKRVEKQLDEKTRRFEELRLMIPRGKGDNIRKLGRMQTLDTWYREMGNLCAGSGLFVPSALKRRVHDIPLVIPPAL